MNRFRIVLSVLLLAGTTLVNAQQKRLKVDGIAAVVGDQIVLDSELGQLKIRLKQQGIDTKQMDDCDILEQLMQDKMLMLEAEKDTTMVVTDTQLEKEADQQIDYMKTQMDGSIDKVLEFYNKKTLIELKTQLKNLNKERKLSQMMRTKVLDEVDISPEEVKQFFDAIPKDKVPEIGTQVELHQIVIKPKADQEEVQKVINKLKEIKKKVENGSSFRVQAVLNTQDPGSRANGGKYVITRKSPFVQEFKDMAFSLEEGQISDPFKTQFGWHILYVEKVNGKERVIRHILLRPEVGFLNRREAQKEIDSIRKRVMDKELTFEEAAKEFSDDEDTKNLGGKIVNPNTGESLLNLTLLDPKLHQYVQNLKEGEITDVISEKDRTGEESYKIIWVKKRVPTHKMGFVKDYPKIKEMALEKKKEKVLVKWMNEHIKDNYIKINKDYSHCQFDSRWKKS